DERLATIADLRRVASSPAPRVANLRRTELRALESAGIAVGNHSHTHPCLPRCRDDKIRSEVADAHAALIDALGHAPTAFAYPNGDCDARTREAVDAFGYEIAFLFDHRLSPAVPTDRLREAVVEQEGDLEIGRAHV